MIVAGLPTSVSFAETEKNPLKKLNSFNANIKNCKCLKKK